MLARLTSLFPLWALLGACLAILRPEWFTGLKWAIIPLLGIVMFGMGTGLTAANFVDVLRRPGLIALGVGLQYLIMPLAAWALAHGLALPPELLAGMVLVGASPGGTATASNVICYLARADVALSITLTLVSTLTAIVATPLLTWLYAGQAIDVPALKMLTDIFKVVLIPVALGIALNRYAGRSLERIKPVFPLISVAAIVLILAIVVALNAQRLGEIGPIVVLAVILHNALGLAGGYLSARAMKLDTRSARTLAIEVGMQNSGLGVALAMKYFGSAAALPGAVFSVWHNLSGSVLAGWWSRRGP